ncbi:MAG: phycobilisome rod-core linker polypeptide [Cyanobacteria bacterium J06641_5]
MPSSFVNPTIANASQLGLGFATDSEPVCSIPGGSASDIEAVIRAVYRQVLGNAYVMESERPIALESPFRQGELSVREFARRLAQSELYRSRFFDNCPRYRAIELNFKHLLGRAPESYAEMVAHSDILDRYGFAAEIDAYIDSDEYSTAFGEDVVPYYRGHKTQSGHHAVGFTYLFELFRGAASSDKASIVGTRPHLTTALVKNIPSRALFRNSSQDGRALLADLFKPKPTAITGTATPVATRDAVVGNPIPPSLAQECQERAERIATLEKQLADLGPQASIGQASLSSWQSPAATEDPITMTLSERAALQFWQKPYPQSSDLIRCAKAQKKVITYLEQKIADGQRYVLFGERRLNKWRKL